MADTASRSRPRELPVRLNLGCGDDYRDDWHNVDIDPAVNPDDTLDASDTPWPFPSNHFKRIDAWHVLEHVDAVPWGELARVLAADGVLELRYPIGHTRFEDTTHEQFWNYNSAEQSIGGRKHAHEVDAPLELVARDVDWAISQCEPLVELYTRYRLLVRGPGPWLSQIPGLYGEVQVAYRRDA